MGSDDSNVLIVFVGCVLRRTNTIEIISTKEKSKVPSEILTHSGEGQVSINPKNWCI